MRKCLGSKCVSTPVQKDTAVMIVVDQAGFYLRRDGKFSPHLHQALLFSPAEALSILRRNPGAFTVNVGAIAATLQFSSIAVSPAVQSTLSRSSETEVHSNLKIRRDVA